MQKQYVMGIQEINVILAHYQRQVKETDVCKILRGGNKSHYNRMIKSLKDKVIFCFKCNGAIERDSNIVSIRGNKHAKIYHLDCYKHI